MKHLKVIICTHARPHYAAATITTLRAMESGKHRVRYVVAYDAEDGATDGAIVEADAWMFPSFDIVADCKPFPGTLQAVWNRNITDPDHWDYFLPMPDDGFCACQEWDNFIVRAGEECFDNKPVVMGWNDQANPGQLTVPIVSSQWIKLLGDEPLLDPRFPWWFADTAINETYNFVTGQHVPCFRDLLLAGMSGRPNPIMRDVDVWWDFFAATRAERLATAERIRAELGVPEPILLNDFMTQHEARDARGRAACHEIYAELERYPRRPPTEHYLKALAVAKAYLGDPVA